MKYNPESTTKEAQLEYLEQSFRELEKNAASNYFSFWSVIKLESLKAFFSLHRYLENGGSSGRRNWLTSESVDRWRTSVLWVTQSLPSTSLGQALSERVIVVQDDEDLEEVEASCKKHVVQRLTRYWYLRQQGFDIPPWLDIALLVVLYHGDSSREHFRIWRSLEQLVGAMEQILEVETPGIVNVEIHAWTKEWATNVVPKLKASAELNTIDLVVASMNVQYVTVNPLPEGAATKTPNKF